MNILKQIAIAVVGRQRLRMGREILAQYKENCFALLARIGFAPGYKRSIIHKAAFFATSLEDRVASGKLDIAFIVPKPFPGSGGQRVVYRVAHDLRNAGHAITVYVIDTLESERTLRRKASNWYYDMSGIEIIRYSAQLAYHDICFATFWKTAHVLAANRNRVKRPCYFIQDYEPFFYPMGSEYLLAASTYRLGLAHICLGSWCAGMLRRRHDVPASFIPFPLDTHVYNMGVANHSDRGKILFFAKPEMDRRCFQIGCDVLRYFHTSTPDVEIVLFGSKHVKKRDVPFPHRNLGLIRDAGELAELYRNSGLGLVFSPTNPSLVAYEMLACGCPVADLRTEMALDKYGGNKRNVFLLDAPVECMGAQLFKIWLNPEERLSRAKNGHAYVTRSMIQENQLFASLENAIELPHFS